MENKKTVVLGVTGGIAAYKGAEIISRLKKNDIDVHVIMTENAQEFITPLTLKTLSNNKVVTGMFEDRVEWDVNHISLAKKADLVLVAPATANIIGKVANGIADDSLTTTIMATKAKVVFAPAMNENMYTNKIMQDNIEKLRGYGYTFVEPETGMLACGIKGVGKLPKPEAIVDFVLGMLN